MSTASASTSRRRSAGRDRLSISRAASSDMRAPGPGAGARQADRRAVGPRRGRLSGRQFPPRLVGVERQLSRRRTLVLEGRRRRHRRAGVAAVGIERPVRRRRAPTASINFVTAHDGFTLHDLVSYNEKHNEANGEDNRDGEADNRSWNCGVEGPTDDPAIRALRERQMRNFLRRCCCPKAFRCFWAATRWAAHSKATTTRIARTRSCRGSTGSSGPTRRT